MRAGWLIDGCIDVLIRNCRLHHRAQVGRGFERFHKDVVLDARCTPLGQPI
jgi:hypothetical protein